MAIEKKDYYFGIFTAWHLFLLHRIIITFERLPVVASSFTSNAVSAVGILLCLNISVFLLFYDIWLLHTTFTHPENERHSQVLVWISRNSIIITGLLLVCTLLQKF